MRGWLGAFVVALALWAVILFVALELADLLAGAVVS